MDETTKRPDDEDTEGHWRHRATDDDDVQGHNRERPGATDDDDVQGHNRERPGATDDDDVEGHRAVPPHNDWVGPGLNPDEGGESHPRI